MNAKQVKKKLYHMAELQAELDFLKAQITADGWLDDCDWDVGEIITGCKVKDGVLYDCDGEEISDDCRCLDEPLGYAVNQSCGYCEDDFYGTMFFPVDNKGTIVSVDYSC